MLQQAPTPRADAGLRAGRMTAVMRAVSVVDNRPRVLRIAVVENGRVAAERIVPEGVVTIGGGEDASFVVRGAGPRFRLFERDGARWRLNMQRGMSGRVALAAGMSELAGFEGPVALDDQARGKIVIGQTTLLFQLVAPAPIAPKPQLPIAVTGGIADRIDWSLTIVAALSFLFHFGIVGAMYSDWMDPVIEAHDVSLVDVSRVLGHDQPVELPAQPQQPGIAPKEPAKDPVATKEPTPGNTVRPNPSPNPGPSRASDIRAAELARQADAMNMGMIVAINGGPATQAALRRSEVPPVDMSSAAASRDAIATSNGDLKTPSGGDTQVHKGDLSQLATNTKKDGTDRAGTENTNAAPVLTVLTQPPTTSGAVSDADVVVAKLRTRFRKCYENGLSSDPTMHGKVVLNARVAANGEVSGVDIVSNSGLSQPVAACLQTTLGRATFTANGPANVRVPVTFEHQ